MSRAATAVLVLALCAACRPAAAASAPVTEWERTFATPGRPALVLRADDASITVTNWNRPAVGIRVTRRGWSIGTHRITVDASQSGDQVLCEVSQASHAVSFEIGDRTVHVEVSLPRDADLDIATGDGSVRLAPVTGTLRVRTGDGSIEAQAPRGDIQLSTSDGHILALDADGKLEAHSGDGRLDVDGRFDRLDLSTNDGRITAEAREGSRVPSLWSLRTSDGSVSLRIPPSLGAELDLRSGNGGVTVGLPVETSGTLQRHAVPGRLNGGGGLLEIRTSDGTIRVEPL
jgi:hypothetical protein